MAINIQQYRTGSSYDSIPSSKEKTPPNLFDWLNKDIQLFGNQLNMKQKEAFYAEMEVLLKAGLDLKTALELVEDGKQKEKEKALFSTIKESVLSGKNLSEAMLATQKFSDYEVYSLQIAEESGKLAAIFGDLAIHFAKNLQYKRLLISALSYPALVIFVSIISLLFLLQFLVPLFGDIYTRLDQDLPAVTLAIIELSNLVKAYSGYFSIALVAIAAFLFSQKKQQWFQKWSAWMLLKIPVFGVLIQQIYLARFAQALAFLLHSKVPLLNALDLIKKMVAFQPIAHSLNHIQEEIKKGKSLHSGLQKFSIYPRRMIALVKVGEEANQLEAMFSKLANQYNEAVEQQTKMLGSLIEPILIVFLAIVVGLVLVSMYLPIFKLVTNFGI